MPETQREKLHRLVVELSDKDLPAAVQAIEKLHHPTEVLSGPIAEENLSASDPSNPSEDEESSSGPGGTPDCFD